VTYREGYILQGTGPYDPKGISLSGRNTITIENLETKRFQKPIFWGLHSSAGYSLLLVDFRFVEESSI
jgi:hypothetical protein